MGYYIIRKTRRHWVISPLPIGMNHKMHKISEDQHCIPVLGMRKSGLRCFSGGLILGTCEACASARALWQERKPSSIWAWCSTSPWRRWVSRFGWRRMSLTSIFALEMRSMNSYASLRSSRVGSASALSSLASFSVGCFGCAGVSSRLSTSWDVSCGIYEKMINKWSLLLCWTYKVVYTFWLRFRCAWPW